MFSSVPVEEQEEFKQLMDDIQELQHLLNQEFRQKTVSVGPFPCGCVGAHGRAKHGIQLLKKQYAAVTVGVASAMCILNA